MEGKSQLENLLKDIPKSVSVVLKLHNNYEGKTKDVLFNAIQDVAEEMEVDVRVRPIFPLCC